MNIIIADVAPNGNIYGTTKHYFLASNDTELAKALIKIVDIYAPQFADYAKTHAKVMRKFPTDERELLEIPADTVATLGAHLQKRITEVKQRFDNALNREMAEYDLFEHYLSLEDEDTFDDEDVTKLKELIAILQKRMDDGAGYSDYRGRVPQLLTIVTPENLDD